MGKNSVWLKQGGHIEDQWVLKFSLRPDLRGVMNALEASVVSLSGRSFALH